MGTNFIQWNPTESNQENDSAYTSDALRSGGAQSGAILPSATFNKFAYQSSTFYTAFCQMLVAKGYSPQDAPLATLVAILMNVKTSADFGASMILVSYASSIAFNAAQTSGWDLTLTGNVSSSSLTGTSSGQPLAFVISQDATGGRTFVWPGSLTPAGPICPFPNSKSVQLFVVRPGGGIVPVGPMLWITASGIVMQPTPVPAFITTSGTVSNAYQEIVEEVNTSGGNITRSLYSAVGCAGFKVNIKKMDTSTNIITVQPLVGGQTIDGFPNYQISKPFNSLTFFSDGANWVLI